MFFGLEIYRGEENDEVLSGPPHVADMQSAIGNMRCFNPLHHQIALKPL